MGKCEGHLLTFDSQGPYPIRSVRSIHLYLCYFLAFYPPDTAYIAHFRGLYCILDIEKPTLAPALDSLIVLMADAESAVLHYGTVVFRASLYMLGELSH